jgi:hypothetical protein
MPTFRTLVLATSPLQVEDPSQPCVDITHYLSGQFAELVVKVGPFDRLQLGNVGYRFLRQPGHAGSDQYVSGSTCPPHIGREPDDRNRSYRRAIHEVGGYDYHGAP